MIIPMLLSSSFFLTLVKDTVWWNTPGGKVTEHRDQNTASCSLMFYNGDGSVTFDWNKPGQVMVTATDRKWQLPESGTIPVAMQLGDVWLSTRGGSAVIGGVAHATAVGFVTDQAVDDLLGQSDRIVVKTKSGDLTLALTTSKRRTLLSRTHDCRNAIRR